MKTRNLAVWIILAAGILAYANTFKAPFELDDLGAIVDNPTIRNLWRLDTVLSPPRDSGITVNGRPGLNLTFAINYAISGLDVWSYHAVNLAIHLAAALALFGIIRRTMEGRAPARPNDESRTGGSPSLHLGAGAADTVALGAALLWLLHPVQTESVTYIVQRAESLVSLFYLLTLYCFLRYADRWTLDSGQKTDPSVSSTVFGLPPTIWAAFSAAACLFGMATKEVMVSAPLIVLLFDRTFIAGSFKEAWRLRRNYYLGLGATWVVLLVLVLHASGRGGTAGVGDDIAWWNYALTQCRAVVHYLRLAIWPSPLVFDYGIGVEHDFGAVAVQAVVLLALVGATVYALWRFPVAGFFGAAFFALLAPSSSVIPVVTQTIAEHRMYLALAALIVPAVAILQSRLGAMSLAVAGIIAGVLGIATAERNVDYASGLTLWSDTVAKYPSSARGHNNLGFSLQEAGRRTEAIAEYREAIRIRPDYLRARSNLAQALAASGDPGGAMEQYGEIIRIHPDFEGHVAYARMLEQFGRRAEAIDHLQAAVALKPDASDVHINLGNLLVRQNRPADGIAEYQKAIAIQPGDASAYNNLGSALGTLGRYDDAATAFLKALELKPGTAGAQVGLAFVRVRQNRPADAIDILKSAVRDNPDSEVAHNTLVDLLTAAGRTGEAQVERQRTLTPQPQR